MKGRIEDADRKLVTVFRFFSAGKADMGLELIAGKSGLGRQVLELAVNRPGLALTGFFQYFAFKRVQVLGHAEHAYLLPMEEGLRKRRVRELFVRHVPCVVITRHRKVLPELVEYGDEFGTPVLRCPLITGDFVNRATILMEDLSAPRIKLQGTMVEVQGTGVLITGKAGIGKSEAALALIRKGHSLVSDDICSLKRDRAGGIHVSALASTRYHMELRGVGIVHVPSLFGVASVREQKRLDIVVDLARADLPRIEPGPEKIETVSIMGVDVQRYTLTVAPGRDVAGSIEALALNYKLKCLGHDAAKELDDRLIASMGGEGTAGE